jgi:large subunit ribosomal protein L7/L12
VNKRLEQLLKKREILNAQIQKVKSKEASLKRKSDTRRKILLGALMMEMMERGESFKGMFLRFIQGLEKNRE